MVSDLELAPRLREVLRASDLTTTTTATVRRQLEEDFGVDLSGKKAFIREQVDLFLQNRLGDGEGEEGHGEGNDGAKGGEWEEKEGGDAGGGGDGEEGEEEDEEEKEDEEESNGSSGRKKAPSKTSEDAKKRGNGFTKLCSLSPQLQKFVGAFELARTQVVKQLWAYIHKHNLQDPTNKRKIICDARLHELFNVKTIDMFQMNKALAKHIWPMSSGDGQTKLSEKDKQRKKEREGSDELQEKKKQRKTGNTGFLAPLPISDPLINFFGTGERALSRADVVRRMWEYIKQNNLQASFRQQSNNPSWVFSLIMSDIDGLIASLSWESPYMFSCNLSWVFSLIVSDIDRLIVSISWESPYMFSYPRESHQIFIKN